MTSMNIISGISGLVPLIAGICAYRRSSTEMRILTIFLVFVLLIEILGFSLFYNNFDNSWLFHIFTLIEYSFLVFIFSNWQINTILKHILRLSILFFTLVWISAKLLFENFNSMDNYTASLESILLIAISVLTLYSLTKENEKPLFIDSRFWICGAVLIYFSGNFMTFAFSNIIGSLLADKIILPPIHSILNIIANLCYAGGFLCIYPRLNYCGSLSSAR